MAMEGLRKMYFRRPANVLCRGGWLEDGNFGDNSGPPSFFDAHAARHACWPAHPPFHSIHTAHHERHAMPSYQVRPATTRDAKAIAEIHVATWLEAYKDLIPQEEIKKFTVEKRLAYWREAIEYSEPQLLVATEADQVVGFVGFDRSRDAGTKSSVGEIWAMYVSPAHWRQGAGLALWDGARDGLKEEGCTQVTLWVLLNNARALEFYEHAAGFKRDMTSIKTIAVGTIKLEEIRLKRPLD
jgi:ribosomal protein S18 acetylase RimI-like enzyme